MIFDIEIEIEIDVKKEKFKVERREINLMKDMKTVFRCGSISCRV